VKQFLLQSLKIFIIFILCTSLFYFGLRFMHAEYEEMHRYDPPEGPAVKVFQAEYDLFDRLRILLRLGE